jgi:hypothetical protein
MLRFAEGKSMFPGAEDVEREGIVWRPLEEIHDPDIGRLSVKAISNRSCQGRGMTLRSVF